MKKLTPMRRLFRMLTPDKKDIVLLYTYGIFSGIINLSLPLGIQAIISNIMGGQISTSWGILIFIVTVGVSLYGFIQIIQVIITEIIQRKIFVRSSFEMAFRIPRFRTEAMSEYYGPELLNRFFDTLTVQKGISKTLIDFSSSTLQIFFGILLLSFYHPFFVLFGVVLISLLIVIFWVTGPKGIETSLSESKYKYKVAYWLEEVARVMGTFKLAGDSSLPMQKVDKLVRGYLEYRKKHFRVLIFQFSNVVVFKILITSGLLGLGSLLVLQQEINLGQFVASEIIILLVIASAEKLILSMESVYDVLTGLEKMGQVTDIELDEHRESPRKIFSDKEGIALSFSGVTFAYPGNSKPTIVDATFSIEEGEKVVITGKNGCGKTSLLTLMAGLYDTYTGNIVFNRHSLSNLDRLELRSMVGDTLSHEELFESSLEDNIALGKNNINSEDILDSLEIVGLKSFFENLHDGLDTEVRPGGRGLSSSMRQKILLARTLVHHPKLILMDDTFYGMDQQEKERILTWLTDKDRKFTLVAATNEEGIIDFFDKVIHVSKGETRMFDSVEEYLNRDKKE